MFTEKELIGARIILKNVNQGRKFIGTDELMTEMKNESEDEFSGDSSDIEKALSKFEAENLIVRINENTYRILADIATIRDFVLHKSKRITKEETAAYDLDLEELTGSAWTLTDENQAECNDVEEKRAYLEARKRELIRRIQSDVWGDNEDEEESDEEEEENDGDDGEVDCMTLEERCSCLVDEFEQILEDGGQNLDKTDAQGVSWREKCTTLIETLRTFIGEDEAEESFEKCISEDFIPPRDPMYVHALACVVDSGVATNAFLQKHCQIGYFYAYRILAWMENQGFISEASDPHERRRVLLTKEEFTKRFGDIK